MLKNINMTAILTYLNYIKLLQEGEVYSSTEKKNGKNVKQNIDFVFVMSEVIQEALDQPFAFFNLYATKPCENELASSPQNNTSLPSHPPKRERIQGAVGSS